MICKRCGNEDQHYFYFDHHQWYCRKCISFGRLNVGDIPRKRGYIRQKIACEYTLQYPLTNAQEEVSKKIVYYLNQKQDVLVYAACGAGKTELVMESIKMYLSRGCKVGFAISRRQVVLEIKDRLQAAFSNLCVIAVCEGYTDITDGDIIVCTMHQLYRYYETFDLLIMDEVDAFPYRGNDVLKRVAQQSCIGQTVYLTATPAEEMLTEVKQGKLPMVSLFHRPHGYPLILPKVKRGLIIMQYGWLWNFLSQHKKKKIQVLLFVPTIALAHKLFIFLRLWFRCAVFTSQTSKKEECIQRFHQKEYDFLICTTVLERGITIKGIHIVILFADHPVFHEASLIQIIGRVGRNIDMPTGEGLFLCKKKTKDIQRGLLALQKMNLERV